MCKNFEWGQRLGVRIDGSFTHWKIINIGSYLSIS